MESKRMLLLGGTNSAYEIKDYAQKHGVTLIATGKYPDTLLKRISSESYDVDAVDVNGLVSLIKSKKIDAVYPGSNEAVVPAALEAARIAGLPHYCDKAQWDACMNKLSFKELCIKNGVPTAKRYSLSRLAEIGEYPVVVKPADSCGSQGFAVCQTADEVRAAAERALAFSRSRTVLVEKFIPYDSVIIHYTLVNGEAYFCGMSDKASARLGEGGSSVMALQFFPSKHTEAYLKTLDTRVRAMFKRIGLHDGPIWIEAFADNGRFWFNEMGYRFGGSMTYYPVRLFYGFDQLSLMLDYCINGSTDPVPLIAPTGATARYCILPLHVEACTIVSVEGEAEVRAHPNVYAYVPIHGVGDMVENSGTVTQVFCYLHVLWNDENELRSTVDSVLGSLRVLDAEGQNRLFCLLDKGSLTTRL